MSVESHGAHGDFDVWFKNTTDEKVIIKMNMLVGTLEIFTLEESKVFTGGNMLDEHMGTGRNVISNTGWSNAYA